MHAVVVTVQVNNYEEARKRLNENVVPTVSARPGFVTGVWLAPEDGKGLSVAVFETEEQARAMADVVRDVAPPDVNVEGVSVREVAAQG